MNIRRLTGEAFIYTAGNALDAAAGIAVTIAIGRYLTPAELGLADVITATMGVVYFLVCLNLDQALIRYYYDECSPSRERLVTTHVLVTLTGGMLAIALGALAVHRFHDLLTEHAAWVCSLVMISAVALTDHVATHFRLRHEPMRHATVLGIRSIGWATFVALLLAVWHAGVISVFAGRLLGTALALVMGFRWLRDRYARKGSFALAMRSARFALPTVPAGLAAWAILHAPRYFLAFGASYEEVGYYGIGVRVSYFVSLLGVSMSMAWAPFIMGMKDRPESRVVLGRGLLYFITLNTMLVVPMIAFPREIVRVLAGPAYIPAANLVGLMVVATVFSNISLFVFVQISIAERTYWQSISHGAGALVMAVLNLLLIPRWQSVGAAVATVAGQIVTASMMFAAAQRLVRIPVAAVRILIAFAAVAIVFGATSWLGTNRSTLAATGVKCLLVIAAWGTCAAVLGPGEIRSLVRLGRDILTKKASADA